MPRLAALVALLLALALVPAAPARAFDAPTVFAKAKGSVVVVTSLNGFKRPERFGTGFVVGDGTQIVTSSRIVHGASAVIIKTPDGKKMPVQVVDVDISDGLALLRINGKGPALEIAEELPAVGQDVAAIGAPKGLDSSLSTGLISAVRKLNSGREFLQTTIPVSEGADGGPLLDAAGRVVGVAAYVISDFQNLNVAVPCTTLLRFLGRPVAKRKTFEPVPEQHLEIMKRTDGSIEIIQQRKRQ